jgi:hypothetical protein
LNGSFAMCGRRRYDVPEVKDGGTRERAPGGGQVKLSRTDFADVHEALARQRPAAEARRAATEKRVGARLTVEHEVLVATVNPDGSTGETFTALTRDISHAGLGLLQRRRLAHNSLIIISLPRGELQPLIVLCKAIHVRELAEGIYAIGAEFLNETTLGTPGADPAEVAMMG